MSCLDCLDICGFQFVYFNGLWTTYYLLRLNLGLTVSAEFVGKYQGAIR